MRPKGIMGRTALRSLSRCEKDPGLYPAVGILEPVQEPERAQGANINPAAGSLQVAKQWSDARRSEHRTGAYAVGT